jgi:hypothetical protein
MFDRKDWFRLPIWLRRRWWAATDYGARAAPPELIALIEETLRLNEEKENG